MTTSLKLKKNNYRVSALDLTDINRVLQQIGQRLDQVDQIDQNHDAKGKKIVNVGNGVNDSDAATYGQISTGVSAGINARATYFRHFLLSGM